VKISIIGSTQYKDKFLKHKKEMEALGHEVRLPALDDRDMDALGVLLHNRNLIEWADRVDMIWDCRSTCSWGDFCMAFALRKPVKAVYLEKKLMRDVILDYETVHRNKREEN